MDFEFIFSVVGMTAMLGWVLLLFSPLIPKWSDRIAGILLPAVLSIGYLVLIVLFPLHEQGGFGTFAEVTKLFLNPEARMAGWIHFLAFDLFVGAWICKTARQEGIRFWFVLPCLPVTFMFGPAGFLLFSIVRGVRYLVR